MCLLYYNFIQQPQLYLYNDCIAFEVHYDYNPKIHGNFNIVSSMNSRKPCPKNSFIINQTKAVLLAIYFLYDKSPQKIRSPKTLHSIPESFQFSHFIIIIYSNFIKINIAAKIPSKIRKI